MSPRNLFIPLVCAAVAACGGGAKEERGRAEDAHRSKALAGAAGFTKDDMRARCDGKAKDHEASEYDTSGDHVPDVRKVFLRISTPIAPRLVMICREADLNGDGTKDVIRYYDDEGRPLREEADRDFDGRMDVVTYFENGQLVREEADTNHDGKVDMKVFYAAGKAERTERDIAARSTPLDWKPDRWEYFENGRMVRMGTDLDNDGKVDKWDRDIQLRPPMGAAATAADLAAGDDSPEPAASGEAAATDAGTQPETADAGATKSKGKGRRR